MITAEHLYKSYQGGAVPVLKDVSLEIGNGEYVVILGASGSGKSTLLNVLSGLEHADSGNVFYDGVNLSLLTDKQSTKFRRDNIGFVFQQYYLLPHLSVKSNVKMGADLSSNPDYEQIIAAVGLSEKSGRKPGGLSGGEQQRVCIARALAKNPAVLFLDEPTGALDESSGREILEYVLRLKKERKFTMIMVTHNAHLAETADTVVKMNSGKIVEIYRNAAPKAVSEIGW